MFNKVQKFIALSLLVLVQLGCSENDPQLALKRVAQHLNVTYRLVSNVDVAGCADHFDTACFQSTLSLSLASNNSAEFDLYFSHIAPIKWDGHPTLDIEHINGDLHKISFPANAFTSGSVNIDFKAAFWHANHSDIMPNYFVAAQGLAPELVKNTIPAKDDVYGLDVVLHKDAFTDQTQTRRGGTDNLPLADSEWFYEHFAAHTATKFTDDSHRIIPKVKSHVIADGEVLTLNDGMNIDWGRFTVNNAITELYSTKLSDNENAVSVRLALNSGLGEFAYQLNVSNSGIQVIAGSGVAVQYALISLWQLAQDNSLPLGEIEDEPRFNFRGVHFDLSRNFLGKEQVIQLIQQMFLLKLNKLHLHLADDEGWRLEIPGLPELTEIGAYRCFDLAENECLLPQLGSGIDKDANVNGYLSQADYLDILQYAKARHIEVIPSFDLPGHARAAVKSMEARYRTLNAAGKPEQAKEFLLTDFEDTTVYSSVQFYKDNTVNPCIESTYHFVDTVIDAVQRMHKEAGAALSTYHIGADETAGAWKESPKCAALIAANDDLNSVDDLKPYFLKRVINIVKSKGLVPAGWSDGMHKVVNDATNKDLQVNVWDTLFWGGHKIADEFASKNWMTVLSLPDVSYFDFPYANNPLETGYYWASKNTDTLKVFQLMPDNLAANALQWVGRMGTPYEATSASALQIYDGVQAQIWSEAVRTPETFQYLMYPRLYAFAERAWHKAAWEVEFEPNKTYEFAGDKGQHSEAQRQDWWSFSKALTKAIANGLPGNVNVRIPEPGVKSANGKLLANSAWNGLTIEVREADGQWKRYATSSAITSNKQVEFRAVVPGTQRVSRTVVLP